MKAILKIGLLIETSNAYARGLIGGIVAYVRENSHRSLYLSDFCPDDKPPGWLAKWNGHGIIARVEGAAIAEALRQVNVPVVDVSAARLIHSLPSVVSDDCGIAHLAAEHLLQRGFKYFGYCGNPGLNWSSLRGEHFQKYLRGAGWDLWQC